MVTLGFIHMPVQTQIGTNLHTTRFEKKALVTLIQRGAPSNTLNIFFSESPRIKL